VKEGVETRLYAGNAEPRFNVRSFSLLHAQLCCILISPVPTSGHVHHGQRSSRPP
jgi:hypothetical protein